MSPGGAEAAFEGLDRAGLRYCLWRGTPRLERAFEGRSDFDLLVAPEDLEALRRVFTEVDFKRARTAPARTAPGLEDWLGLGGPAGPLQHLHVHTRMLVGEPRLYRFRLPWEGEVLGRRRRRERGPGWNAHPTDEAALLLIRSALQLRWRDRLPGSPAAGRALAKLDHDLGRLLEDSSPAAVAERVGEWLGRPGALAPLARLPRVSAGDLRALRSAARPVLAAHASQGDGAAALQGLRRQLAAGARRLARSGRTPLPRASRSGPQGGRVIAVVGDGRPAAELTRALWELFATKLDAVLIPGHGSRLPRTARLTGARDRGWTVFLTAPSSATSALTAAGADAVFFLGPDAPEATALASLPAQRVDRARPGDGPEELLARALALTWRQL